MIFPESLPSGLVEKFCDKLLLTNKNCWEWYGALRNGYGFLSWKGKQPYTHRIMFEAANGAIPDGLEIDHLCRNRACCNPEHLEAVTPQINVLRGDIGKAARARAKLRIHCPHGHPYSGENTYKRKDGSRECLICRKKSNCRCPKHGGRGK